MKQVRIATRKSALALWQAEYVKSELERHHPGINVELVPLVSRGDKILDVPLAKVGGKGLFVKELEHALLENEADIAVHSMKDVPMEFPEGLGLRRQSQILAAYPHLQVKFLRGNVNTRLAKLDAGEYDAIVLAAAGLLRLEMKERIRAYIEPEKSLPAGGQGAVGIECRLNDSDTIALLAPLHHVSTAHQVLAERAVNRRLEGGCQVPIGCFARLEGDNTLWLRALVAEPNGSKIIQDEMRGPVEEGEQMGEALAERLLAAGADKILAAVYGAK